MNLVNSREANTVTIGMRGPKRIRLKDSDAIKLTLRYDKNGTVAAAYLENVQLLYYRDFKVIEERSYTIEVGIPKARFYSGNDLLFEYCLLAKKGLYFTGRTSSVVGNIYAGTHEALEFRQAEARYGEKEIYGGINILSTQLGVEGDYIVTQGDINVKDAFVMFGFKDEAVRLYAHALNRLDGFGSGKNVTVIGDMTLNPTGEEYENLIASIESGLSKLDAFADYYDSDNDKSYQGTYRKILSNYDVIVSGDFQGAIATAGNVIVEEDANVEGIIIAGDRIYVRGNNNIVSNNDILRVMIDEEFWEEQAEKQEQTTEKDEFFVSHRLKDYIGDIRYKGINAN